MRLLNLSEKMTQHQIKNIDLAKAMRQTPKAVSAWRRGKAYPKEMSLIYLLSIFKYLEVETDDGQEIILRLGDQSYKYKESDINPIEATTLFTDSVSQLLETVKNVDESSEVAQMVKDLIHNGEGNEEPTKRYISALGEAAIKSIRFLRQLSTTPEAVTALAAIEKEMGCAA